MKCDSIGQSNWLFQINARRKTMHWECKSGLKKHQNFPSFLSPVTRINCLESCLTGASLVGYCVRCAINGGLFWHIITLISRGESRWSEVGFPSSTLKLRKTFGRRRYRRVFAFWILKLFFVENWVENRVDFGVKSFTYRLENWCLRYTYLSKSFFCRTLCWLYNQ